MKIKGVRPNMANGFTDSDYKDISILDGYLIALDAVEKEEELGWGAYVDEQNNRCLLGAVVRHPALRAAQEGFMGVHCEAFGNMAMENDKFGDDESPKQRRDRMVGWLKRRIVEERAKVLFQKVQESPPIAAADSAPELAKV